MSSAIRVSGKVLGRRPSLERLVPLPTELPLVFTLRELITHIVLEEVRAFHQRQERRTLIPILTEAEIAQGAESGKIAMEGYQLRQEVNPQAALEVALQSFEDGFYLVFIDGVQYRELADVVEIRPRSEVTFIRLVPLAGG